MKFIATILLLTTISLSADPEPKPTTWTDPELAHIESPAYRYTGEFKNSKLDVYHQVALLKDGNYLVTTYPKGLPGRGWVKTIGSTSEIFTPEQAASSENNWLAHFFTPLIKAGPPENAILMMPDGFTNVKNGLLKVGGRTTQKVGSFQMHVQFMIPFKPHRNPTNQDKGNSGIYIFNNYEIQILDTFAVDYSAKKFPFKIESKKTQWCGSLYKTKVADLNMCLPPLRWQTFYIDFTAPVFKDKKKVKNARITVYQNDVMIHDDVELKSGTGQGANRPEVAKGHIYFQNHGNPVIFRKAWIVETNK